MEKIENIDYHLTDRCNLNCISCGHICPLVTNAVDKDLLTVYRDLSVLSEVTNKGSKLNRLTLTGGECTLNDQFIDILYIARDYFLDSEIKIWTNGLNWKKLCTKEYINGILENNMILCLTDYGFKNFDEIVSNLKGNYENNFFYVTRRTEDNNIPFFDKFLATTEVASEEDILDCYGRRECLQLYDQKVFICQYAAYIKYLKSYFNINNIYDISNGFIDLKNCTYNQLVDFIKTANPDICKYCLDCLRTKGKYNKVQNWRRSNKDINEWIETDTNF